MSKYIIELGEDANMVQAINVTQNGNVYVGAKYVAELKELTADYINEHFGDLQDTAYKKGFEDGQNQNEAWKYARKIACVPQNGGMDRAWLDAIFGSALDRSEILFTFSAKNAIEKIKAYEKKQADKIGAGDVVIYNQKKCVVVTPETNEKYASLFDCNGNHYSVSSQNCQKTGEHYNINEILGGLSDD